jgi:HEAT repeat protein
LAGIKASTVGRHVEAELDREIEEVGLGATRAATGGGLVERAQRVGQLLLELGLEIVLDESVGEALDGDDRLRLLGLEEDRHLGVAGEGRGLSGLGAQRQHPILQGHLRDLVDDDGDVVRRDAARAAGPVAVLLRRGRPDERRRRAAR